LPLIMPAVMSSLLISMILSFDELIVSLFVSSARVRPVAVQMWSNLLGDFDPTIAAIASVCFLFALLLMVADLALRAGRSLRLV
jgi:putative spermidine/putrescine transport system permease protein